ncbi:uncharacterized protein HMPREF1541_09546 [Cyphellophora europaea CBS 101466]|uniref:FAS1 domain-containing protein n=1 Tax=Cyphellophora europaea (strain CBS 101466) TaxID=1220924 RepID=W2SCE7_CYPE1|nr:uncharacterized protein HMPREF1541_09546 [Cyphellophora europaea CBS 101466]ETN45713.1 hypothetical protein HMPREF1541_09546 [Cyphellophora europaea CBS 101466]
MRFSSFISASMATATAQDLISVLQSQPDLSVLFEALQTVPELASTLNGCSNITILAPTDGAFTALLSAPLNAENQALNTKDPNGTINLLSYHVLREPLPSASTPSTPTYVQTLFTSGIPILGSTRTNVTGGQNVQIVSNGSAVQCLSGDLQISPVVEADITIGDIVVHKIDSVLSIPNNITTTGPQVGGTAAVPYIEAAGLAETLDIVPDLTLFVPTNDAVDAIGSVLAGASIEFVAEILQ